jgi:formate dehydrogenase major subunit
MNAERRIQRVRKAIQPLGESKPDWEIICAIAHALGKAESFSYAAAEEIWNEVRSVWPAGRGITYERLEKRGIQWPCLDEADAGLEILHSQTFGHGKTTALRRIPFSPSKEATEQQFPFLLNTGRTLYQFNAGTMTRRTANLELLPTDYLDIAPADAESLELKSGERVQVRSRYGEVTLPVRVDSRVNPGELFATFHDSEVFLNHATSSYRDRYVKTPEYKVTAVSIKRLKNQS